MLMLLRPVKQATSSAPQPQAVLPCDAERFQRRLLSPDLPLGKNNRIDGRSVQRPMKLPQIPLVSNVKKHHHHFRYFLANTTNATDVSPKLWNTMGDVAIFLNFSRSFSCIGGAAACYCVPCTIQIEGVCNTCTLYSDPARDFTPVKNLRWLNA